MHITHIIHPSFAILSPECPSIPVTMSHHVTIHHRKPRHESTAVSRSCASPPTCMRMFGMRRTSQEPEKAESLLMSPQSLKDLGAPLLTPNKLNSLSMRIQKENQRRSWKAKVQSKMSIGPRKSKEEQIEQICLKEKMNKKNKE